MPREVDVARLTVAAIIPTKNRASLLAGIVERLLAQTATIDELVIVDQSDTDDGRIAVRRVLEAAPASRRPALDHVWDRAINGAAAARNVAFDRAHSDVLLCVDDDMEPAPDAIERLLQHLAAEPQLAAVTPVITNYEAPALTHRLVSQIFFRGPFHDDRQPVYWRGAGQRERLVDVGMLGAGMIAIQRSALAHIRFDPRYRGASLGEDLDLSWALRARGGKLAIATDAHVIHRKAPRPASRHEEAMLTSWGFVYAKHQPKTLANRLAFAWFVTGVATTAAVAALRARSLTPLRSVRAGLFNIRHDYSRCSFLTPPTAPTVDATGAPGSRRHNLVV